MVKGNDEVERLFEEAGRLSDGPIKVALLEQAVAIADAHQDVQLGYQARRKLLPACLDAGLPDLMLVAYTWCLAQCDRDPSQFSLDDILWEYRWVVSEMPTFPTISKPLILEALADITQRYQAAGSTLRAIHLLKLNVSLNLKDSAMADAAREAWRQAPRDRYSDDQETERAFIADYHFFKEDYEAAIKQCASVLKGNVKSDHFFGSDCSDLLYPLWKTGRLDDAENCHKRGYRYVAWNPRYVDCCADHVEYLTLTNQWPRASRLIEKHLPIALAARKPNDRLHFLRAVLLFAKRAILAGQDTTSLKLPEEFPIKPVQGKTPLAEMVEYLQAEVRDWSQRYDQRNGNTWFADRLSRVDQDAATEPLR